MEVGAVGKAVRVCRQGRQLSLMPCGEGTETQSRLKPLQIFVLIVRCFYKISCY